MKREIRLQKLALYETQLNKALNMVVQTPTGKEVFENSQARGTSYELDFSLGKDSSGTAYEKDDGSCVISSCTNLLPEHMFGAFIENITHESIHACVKNNVNYIDFKPVDYNYNIQLDEANAVAKSIQIAYEMHTMGIDSRMWDFINGEALGKRSPYVAFEYENAIDIFNSTIKEDPNSAKDGSAMRNAFLARLTLDRRKRDLSTFYDQDDFKYIQAECDASLRDMDVINAKNKLPIIENNYGRFLTRPKEFTEKDVAKFGIWQGSNYLRTENGSLGYLLSDKMKTEGLNGFAKNALTKTNLIVERTRHQLGFAKSIEKNKENITLTQANKQKGR